MCTILWEKQGKTGTTRRVLSSVLHVRNGHNEARLILILWEKQEEKPLRIVLTSAPNVGHFRHFLPVSALFGVFFRV